MLIFLNYTIQLTQEMEGLMQLAKSIIFLNFYMGLVRVFLMNDSGSKLSKTLQKKQG